MQIPPKLREYLAGRECVAFVGAGFSAPCGMPAWEALFSTLLTAAHKSLHNGDNEKRILLTWCEAEVERGNYLGASIGIRKVLSEQELSHILMAEFSHDRLKSLPTKERKRMEARLENLVRGPWSGIITTNYDTLIEYAFNVYASMPMRADGEQPGLGHVLCLPHGAANFLVKLHGDTWTTGRVLCTDDYVRAWQSSSRIRHFLTATMLHYHIVFIGSSVEDEILRLRQSLWNDFSRRLPRSYALLPDTSRNRLRREALSEDAGIEVILYGIEADGGQHLEVDSFLLEARSCSELPQSDTMNGTLTSLSQLTVEQRLNEIGEINRGLLRVVRSQPDQRLEDKFLYDPLWASVDLVGEHSRLRAITAAERLYRFVFLVAIDLLRETATGSNRYYELVPSVAKALVRA